MAKLQGFCCPVTNPSSSSSTVLRSILRKLALLTQSLLPCPVTGQEGAVPQSLTTCVLLSSASAWFIPQPWLVMFPTPSVQLWDLFVCLQQQLQQEEGAGSITELM